MPRLLCFLVLVGSALTLPAGPGRVWTQDGRKLEGDVELAKEALLIKTAQGPTITVGITNLAQARFSTNASTMPGGKGHGLLGVYYATSNLTGSAVMRLDDGVNFSWAQAPILGLPKDSFSVRWMGYLEAPATDRYTIHFGSDDGGRIYLDDEPVADHWSRQGYAETNVAMTLKAGEKRKLKLEHFDSTGSAQARLYWSTDSMPKSIVPGDHLHAASFDPEHRAEISGEKGLLATYYNGDDFTGNSFTRIDPEIDFDWKGGSPAPGIASNRFSVRWLGSLLVTNVGADRVHVHAGLPVRFWINQRLLSDPWKAEPEQILAATLEGGERCEVRLELRVTNNASPVKLSWSGPAFPKTLISRHHLSPHVVSALAESPTPNSMVPAGVLLTAGVTIAAPIHSATDSSIQFRGMFSRQPPSMAKVSHIFVTPLTSELVAGIPKGRRGVLLKNRDFIDGEFVGIQNGQLKVGSVLFGNRAFDLAKEVVAVVVRPRELLPWRYSVMARDGTMLYGPSISITPSRIAFPTAPEYAVPASELLELSRRMQQPGE